MKGAVWSEDRPRAAWVRPMAMAAILLTAPNAFAEPTAPSGFDVGVEVQGYPAGVISALRARVELLDHFALFGYLALNITERQDFGEHDDEDGLGFGGGLAARVYWNADRTGFHAGARLDVWSIAIDWQDTVDRQAQGTTDIVVVQPTGQLGYTFRIGDRFLLEPTLSLGAEINVVEDGESVGQGAILLLGLGAAWQL